MPEVRATPIPGDVPLFDVPAAPVVTQRRQMPIAPPRDYLAAVERADGQCEHARKSDRKRCVHSLRGGYKLRIAPDATFVCDDHWNDHRGAAK